MKRFAKRMRLATFSVTWLIVLSLSFGALAHGTDDPSLLGAPWFSGAADAVLLTDQEMAEISGEVSPIVASAVAGAVYSAFEYATSPGTKSVSGLVKNTVVGAVSGAIVGTAATVAAAAKVVKTVESAATVAWAVWGSANAGAVSGAAKHLIGN